ncbi:MAG: repeat protein [Bacteroidota bacterium]|nr:repeat protein [Bacteroidota bacterium]
MEKKLLYFILFLVAAPCAFSEEDYKTGSKNKDGFTTIYKTTYIPAANYYSSSTTITRYGLMEEKTKKIILPMKYTVIYTAYEDGLYIVEDTLSNYGIFSAKAGRIIVEPIYNRVEAYSEGLAVVQKKTASYDYFYGAVDKTGKLIIPVQYTYLGNLRDGLMNFKGENKKFGFINKENKVVIEPQYVNMGYFSNGLAPASLSEGALYGYINKENKFVVEPKYEDAETFYNGYAEVYKHKKSYSKNNYSTSASKDEIVLIDTTGKEITDTYESISLRKDGGIFMVKKNDKYGLIDSTGKVILPVEYKEIKEFSDGMAIVQKEMGYYGVVNTKGALKLNPDYNYLSGYYKNGLMIVKKDGKYSVLDKNMKTVIPADSAITASSGEKRVVFVFNNKAKVFDVTGKLIKNIAQESVDVYGTRLFSNDDSVKVPYFKVINLYNLQTAKNTKLEFNEVGDFNEEGIFIGKNTTYTFVDYTGKKLSDKWFANVVNFSEGICAIQETQYSKPYLADKSLNNIAELSTVFYGPYSEGLAMAKGQYAGYIYYLDKKGYEAFKVYATDGGACKNGRILIKDATNKFFYVDKSGKAINSSLYDAVGSFSEGFAWVKLNGKCGYIDTSGKMIINPQFDEVGDFTSGASIVKSGTDYYQIDKTGKQVGTEKYVTALMPANGTFPVKKGTQWGLIDSKGNKIIDFKYQEISARSEGLTWAKQNGKWGVLGSSGTATTAFEYEGATPFEKGYSKVSKNGKLGLIDKNGKVVIPFEYTSLSSVYNNAILTVMNSGTALVSVK